MSDPAKTKDVGSRPPAPAGYALDDEEREVIEGLLHYWQNHAQRCDVIPNRKMGQWQKAKDLVRVRALTKILAHNAKLTRDAGAKTL